MRRTAWMAGLMLSVTSLQVSAKSWNEITPCVSSRIEAEKLLGKSDQQDSDLGIYHYKKYLVFVRYKIGDTQIRSSHIVERIDVSLNAASIRLAKYVEGIRNFPEGFKKTVVPPEQSHVGYLAFYEDDAEGFAIQTQTDEDNREIATGLSYYPRSRSCK